MRFVIAIVLFVVAFVSIGLGLAQRTILAGPSSVTHEVSVGGSAPLTVIRPGALHANPGTQSVTVSGRGAVFLAAGRESDIQAWIGKTDYATVSWSDAKQAFTEKSVEGTERTAPSPAGSDLWVQEYTGTTELNRKFDAPQDVALLVATDGTKPAPSRISIT